MKRYLQLMTACWLLALVVLSCKSTEKTTTDGTTTIDATFSQKSFIKSVGDRALSDEYLTAKLKFSATLGGQDVSVGGSLKMKRNDVIRIQLVALGLFEAGRMEFTKDYVMIMDRVNKQYVKAAYDDIDFLRNNGINFYTLQALFWNQLFQPGKEQPQLSQFEAQPQADGTVLLQIDNKQMNCQWLADRQTAQISRATIAHQRQGTADGQMEWNYAAFKKTGKTTFPTDQRVNIQAKGKTLKAQLQLSSLGSDSNWETRTSVGNKYTQVDAEAIFRKLMSM